MDDLVDLHIIDYDGNLMDAAVLGSMAALMNTKIPEAKVVDDEVVIDEEKKIPLPIKEKALMCTFAKIGGELIVDPSLEEEQVMSSRISIGMRTDGSICSMQKGGMQPLTKDEIIKAVARSKVLTKKLMEHLPQNKQ